LLSVHLYTLANCKACLSEATGFMND